MDYDPRVTGTLLNSDERFYGGIKGTDALKGGRAAVFSVLREKSVMNVEVRFSGGNDEGGTDEIILYFEDGSEKNLEEHIWPDYKKNTDGSIAMETYTDWGGEQRQKRVLKDLTEEQMTEMELAQALATPVYDQYSSFAGDFSVSGEVTWYVTGPDAGRVVMDGEESVEKYESIGGEV